MKKLFSLILIILLLLPCLLMNVHASDAFAVSEDYKTLTFGGHTYSRADVSMMDITYNQIYETPSLSNAQLQDIKDTCFECSEDRIFLRAEFYFHDGSTLTVTFLRDDYRHEYESLFDGTASKIKVDMLWPKNNSFTAEKAKLMGETAVMHSSELEIGDTFHVYHLSANGTFCAGAGKVYHDNGTYYYVDFFENGIEPQDGFYYEYRSLIAHKITDTDILADLEYGYEQYLADDYGIFYDDTFSDTFSAVFLTLLFGIVPLGVLVLAVVLTIRSRGHYRTVWGIITGLSGTVVLVFIIVVQFISTAV